MLNSGYLNYPCIYFFWSFLTLSCLYSLYRSLPFHNSYSIPEPPPKMPNIPAVPGSIDLMIVPGLAFDASGNRLGQGKGYYDRFIEKMSVARPPILIAVGLDCQMVDSIPVQAFDQAVDKVLLPSQAIVVKHKQAS